jgi:uncharacterized protein (TIRG00374 family)
VKKAQIIQVFAGLLIAAAGLYIFFRDVKLEELWKQIASTSIWVILGVALLNPVMLWIRALRWKVILPSSQNTHKRGLFGLVMIGFMANNILPARLGEAARAVLLWKRNGFTVVESAGSLVLERILDILVFSTFFFIPIFFKSSLSALFPWAAVIACGFCVIVAGFFTYSIRPKFSRGILIKLMKMMPLKIRTVVFKFGRQLISNLDWVFSFRKVVLVIFYSFLTLICQVLMMLLLGMRIDGFGVLEGMFGVAAAAFGAAIPLSPGYVGTLHAALRSGLSLVGVTSDNAGAIAVLYHAVSYITVTALGLICLFSIRISFKEIGKAKENLKDHQDSRRVIWDRKKPEQTTL